MVQHKPIDMQRLWEMAQQGKNAQEIMTELDIADKAELKNAIQNLVDAKGEDLTIDGLDQK